MLQKPIAMKDPQVIKPLSNRTWKYQNPEFFSKSDIYSEQDLSNLRDAMMLLVEISALLNDFARKFNGMPVRGSESIIVKMWDEQKFESISHNYWSSVWNKFLKFRIISAGFIGFMIIWQFIKYCTDVLLRGVTLHIINGFFFTF